jgi:hypothetical protein
MPTAALAQLDFDAKVWAEVSFDGGARLIKVWRPKDERG